MSASHFWLADRRVRGHLFEQADEALLEPLAQCLVGASQPEELGATALKAGRVWRLGDKVIKRYASTRWRDRARASTAVRVARLYRRILPIQSPRPRAVLELPRALGAPNSMLVMDRVEGEVIKFHWSAEPAAQAAFGPFMAELHRRKLFHGDFHMGNLMWDGAGYVLLDIESLRPAWSVLQPQRLYRRQWVRVVSDLGHDAPVEAAYHAWLSATKLAWPAGAWGEIAREGERAGAERRRRHAARTAAILPASEES
ncbi:MAG: hypothetical protein E2O39_00655 [Planctomycetota bacterium]|nr:MAG: hypothetical protein E2O39_00655 [Planctomycetota bacterium]